MPHPFSAVVVAMGNRRATIKGGAATALAAATYSCVMVIVSIHNAHTALHEFKVHSACTLHLQ